MPNSLAYLMLLIWPLVVWALYRHTTPVRALIWTVLGGYLLLPPVARIDMPVVPDLDKYSIANLSAFAMSYFLLRDRISFLPHSLLGKVCIILFIIGPFLTVITNGEVIEYDYGVIPALRIYDSVALVANQFIGLLPFFLARHYLRRPEDMREVAIALVIAGLAYSVPMLVEVRLSPQINTWVYGFFQHSFDQMIRFGGFRPIVFLPHGLWAAFFALMTVLSALMLLRVGPAEARPKYLAAALYLGAVLVLCKSVGPLAYASLLAPVLLFAGKRFMLLMAAAMAMAAILYPIMRGVHLVPIDFLLEQAEAISADRAQSLGFRFENEEILLNRASEKILFGWGGYGRNHLFEEETGRQLTIADGGWIIAMGTAGWVGYLAQFGLLALPLLLMGGEALRQRAPAFSLFTCLVALMLGTNLFDMLPNATLIPFTWLLAGALLGHAESLIAERKAAGQEVWRRGLPPRGSRTVL